MKKYRIIKIENGFGKSYYIQRRRRFLGITFWFDYVVSGYIKYFPYFQDAVDEINKLRKPAIKYYKNFYTALILISALVGSCATDRKVNTYYIGFRKTGKAMQVVAIPDRADLEKWVILDTIFMNRKKQPSRW